MDLYDIIQMLKKCKDRIERETHEKLIDYKMQILIQHHEKPGELYETLDSEEDANDPGEVNLSKLDELKKMRG